MVTLDPTRIDPKRLRMEAGIRVVDLGIYALVLGAGIFATLFTPNTVAVQLEKYVFLIGVWCVLLVIGGLAGFAGRLHRWWILELPGTAASTFGTAIYAVVLFFWALKEPTVWVAVVLMLVAMLTSIRRWLELRIFTSTAEKQTFSEAWAAAIRRRTENAVNRG